MLQLAKTIHTFFPMAKTKHDMYLKLSLTLLILAHVLATTNGLDSPSSKTGRPYWNEKLYKDGKSV